MKEGGEGREMETDKGGGMSDVEIVKEEEEEREKD